MNKPQLLSDSYSCPYCSLNHIGSPSNIDSARNGCQWTQIRTEMAMKLKGTHHGQRTGGLWLDRTAKSECVVIKNQMLGPWSSTMLGLTGCNGSHPSLRIPWPKIRKFRKPSRFGSCTFRTSKVHNHQEPLTRPTTNPSEEKQYSRGRNSLINLGHP